MDMIIVVVVTDSTATFKSAKLMNTDDTLRGKATTEKPPQCSGNTKEAIQRFVNGPMFEILGVH